MCITEMFVPLPFDEYPAKGRNPDDDEEDNPGLDFHRIFQAPHYSSKATRIAYYQWELSYPGLLS